jgi:hypothetical protein
MFEIAQFLFDLLDSWVYIWLFFEGLEGVDHLCCIISCVQFCFGFYDLKGGFLDEGVRNVVVGLFIYELLGATLLAHFRIKYSAKFEN